MTTPNVNAPVQIPAGAQEITSNKAKGDREDQSFMDVLSIADSAAKTKAPEKDIKADTKAPKETKQTEAVKPKEEKQESSETNEKGVKDTTKTEKKEEVREDKDAKIDTNVKEAVEEVKGVIKEKLGITDEELTQVMETLGLTMTDLLDPKAMTEIVAEVREVTPVDIVADEALSGIVTDLQSTVREVTSDLVQKLDITPEEFKNTLAEIKNEPTIEYEVVSPKPEATKENNDDLKVVTDEPDKTEAKPETNTVRTPAEAVTAVKTEAQPDRTERISERSEDSTGKEEVSLNVKVEDRRDQSSMTGNDGQSQTPSDDIFRSGQGRARHTEAHAEVNQNNNNIFFQNLNTAVTNTLESIANTQTQTTGTTMVDAMDLINQINSQIRAVIDNETQSLSMQLHPQSLGRLNVELIAKAGQLTAQFEAENASVKAALETRLVELKETLEQRGVRVESVEVTIASHEFEQNLMGGEQSGDASQESGRKRGSRTRSINLNETEVEGIDGEDTPDDERIAREMMAANGNSVDYMA